MAALPPGNQGAYGVSAVKVCVSSFEKVPELSPAELTKRLRMLGGYADDLTHYCDPVQNSGSFRLCQVAARPAVEGLLAFVMATTSYDSHISALMALARVSCDCVDNTNAVLASERFEQVFSNLMRPIFQIKQQEELLALLQLLQTLIATAPEEAPSLARALAPLPSLLLEEVPPASPSGFAACSAVRLTALEVLVSYSLSNRWRTEIVTLFPETHIRQILANAPETASNSIPTAFLLGLLMANLLDIPGTESLHLPEFQALVENGTFFEDLTQCFDAAMQSKPWPSQSGIYHAPGKLATTCFRLARAGFAPRLRSTIPMLAQLVEQRIAATEVDQSGAGESLRKARLAATAALRELSKNSECRALMQHQHEDPMSVAEIQADEPGAQELIELVAKETSVSTLSELQPSYEEMAKRPW